MGLAKAKLGFDETRATAGLAEAVKAATKAKLVPVDGVLSEARAVKNPAEVALIEKSCEFADRGIIHALNHLEGTLWGPGYTVPELVERVRVHAFESGASGVGHMATTVGDDTRLWYAPHRGDVHEGQLIRNDITAHSMGYWCSISRMAYTGYAPPEVEDAYAENQELKQVAVSMLKPGTRCDKVYAKVKSEAEKMGAKPCGPIVGHGVGCSHFEAPYISAKDDTKICPGMAIVIRPVVEGPKGELLWSSDTVVVEEDGPRVVGWYRDWRTPYLANYTL